MQARDLRRAFQGFFKERDHEVVASGSLIPHDPSLLFTVAGMVPFKPYFVGEEKPPWPRAVTVQKCVRAGGKHNDLDEIGRTKRHLTFFEMMGNFSFGDYFKEDAIPYAWDFTTNVMGFDPEKLWVTVHISDDEAEEIWRDKVGVAPDRIQRLDEDNYWRMAETGPCGPSSEIFYDKGPQFGEDGGPLNGGEERFLEFWNLVFMQFEQHGDGTQSPLPAPSIDTGAGLERILTLMQNVDSIWDIDELNRLVRRAGELAKVEYGRNETQDVSLRILADHARSMTFLISDSVFPSNEARGYVLRRIMRRAIRHAYLLGVNDIVTPTLVNEVVDIMAEDYPALKENQGFIVDVVQNEEERFRRTLKSGSTMLDAAIQDLDEDAPLSGGVAFTLHDTYGFPLEVTEEIARERGVALNIDEFNAEMDAQRARARADQKSGGSSSSDVSGYHAVLDSHGETEFVGREVDEIEATVLAVTEEGVVLDRTPFYAESGGQIGDTGAIVGSNGEVRVIDTTSVIAGIHLHRSAGATGVLHVGDTVTARIDSTRRAAIKRNHTGTHLLHWALRDVVGDHVKQQGSMVGPDRLRFDFSHFDGLTDAQIEQIEDMVNNEILTNEATSHAEMSMAEAEAKGAIAFFGDKYGDRVRVLEAGPHSIELCGGTHVSALGDIGPMKIVSEASIGSNLRRVEAVTGLGPIQRLREEEALVAKAASALGVPVEDIVVGATKRTSEIKELRDEIKQLRRQLAVGQAGTIASKAVDGVVVERIDGLDRDAVRDLAVAVRDVEGIRAVVLGAAPEGGGAALVAAVAADAGLHAGEIIAGASKLIKGGGGKAADLAVAGGKDPDGLDAALEMAREAIT